MSRAVKLGIVAAIMVVLLPLMLFAFLFIGAGGGSMYQKVCDEAAVSTAMVGATVTAADVTINSGGLTVKGAAMAKEQAQNAAEIIGIGVNRNLPQKAWHVLLTAATVESELRNVNYGDRDSLGLFQMRPSMGWGTPEQILDTTYAINRMYRELENTSGWQSMSVGAAAQAIEKSGYPDRYFDWDDEALRTIKAAKVGGGNAATTSLVSASYDLLCDDGNDPIEEAVLAALSREGDNYGWQDESGAPFVTWAFDQADIGLPRKISGMAAFEGDEANGVSATWIPASRVRQDDVSLRRGDLVFYGSGRQDVDTVKLFTGETVDASGGELRIGTYNVLGRSHTPNNGPRAWDTRMRQSIRLLDGAELAVVGLQEFQPAQRRLFMQLTDGRYGIFPKNPQYKGSAGGASVNSIVWDATRYRLARGGYVPMPYYFGGARKQIPSIVLEHRRSGRQFRVINTHDPAHARHAKLRYLNAQQHARDTNRLSRDGLPLFFTGDFNSGFDLRKRGNATYQNRRENLTWCVMTKSGVLYNAYDAWRGRGGYCPRETTRERGDGPIDHVYVSSDVRVRDYEVLPAGDASDHPLVYADVSVPGVAGGDSGMASKPANTLGATVAADRRGEPIAQMYLSPHRFVGVLRLNVERKSTGIQPISLAAGEWVSPLASSYSLTSPFGMRVHPVTGVNKLHDGQDFGVGRGTAVRAASSGRVVIAGYQSAWGNHVVINHGGVWTLYAHLQSIDSRVRVNSAVAAGQRIGAVNSTGYSTGDHLHFSVYTEGPYEGAVDPMQFLRAQGVRL